MSQTPSIAEIMLSAVDSKMSGVFTAMPARVVAYNATRQSVDVQPLIYQGYITETGDRAAERLPVIPGVPVVFPGAGGMRITFPVAVGDTMLLVFANSSIDRWLVRGGEVDPADDRRHALADAIAIPGLRDFARPTAANTTALVIEGSDVRLGDDSGTPVALKSDIDALASWIHTEMIVNATGAVAGTSTVPPTAFGAQKVKAT